MPEMVAPKLLVWGKDGIEPNTIEQAKLTTTLPFLGGHVALMPDAHAGRGSTVGSVIPTLGAIIPAAVGVDIGCGMASLQLDITEDDLPDLQDFMKVIEVAIPAGMGKGHEERQGVNVEKSLGGWFTGTIADSKLRSTAISQAGSLGSGNHFFEISIDQGGGVWIVLHSGSRGIGNKLAQGHIKNATKKMKAMMIQLADPDLAYLVQDEPDFQAYISDMLWAQAYALLNREIMLENAFLGFCGYVREATGRTPVALDMINCHHNFTQMEHHNGKDMWITRKGAIKADVGDMGIIPGSMGADTYIVSGLGNASSYNSCSHGAGRQLSRTKAKATYSSSDLAQSMEGRVWNSDRASSLVDEIPGAYKDIHQVMEAQKDLVHVEHRLHQVFNYKG